MRSDPAQALPSPMHEEYRRGDFLISTDPALLDVTAIHAFLSGTDWARGVPIEIVARSLSNSLTFGLYHGGRQIGLARVITDRATFGYLADVYVLEAYRGRGLARWLMGCLVGHPGLQTVRRLLLSTHNAHALYAAFGFRPLKAPEDHLERRPPAAVSIDCAAAASRSDGPGARGRCVPGQSGGDSNNG